MLELLFVVMMITIFGKLIIFSIKAAWGVTKILMTVVFLPLILIGLLVGGLVSIAFPILLVVGVISMFCLD